MKKHDKQQSDNGIQCDRKLKVQGFLAVFIDENRCIPFEQPDDQRSENVADKQ